MTAKLYCFGESGNAYKCALALTFADMDWEPIYVDFFNGGARTPEFRAINEMGEVPVLEDGDTVITDSNAILIYLARRYDASNSWAPVEPKAAAEVQRFLSAAAGQVAFGPAAARLVNVFGAALDHQRAIEIAHNYLVFLDKHLDGREWLVGVNPTVADAANYAYIAHAPEGDVSLAGYPNVVAWLRRLEGLPGFVAMQETRVGLAA